MPDLIPQKKIENKIYLIKGLKVMLDKDLAELYGVETRVLNQAVRRNIKRFPEDFMFQLTKEEMKNWISQFVISNSVKMGIRKLPLAFTEQGVAMLSSVLNSERAIQINIAIMRIFVKFKQFVSTGKELNGKEITVKLNQIDRKMEKHDKDTKIIMNYISTSSSKTVLISPTKPFSNKKAFRDIISSCEKHIYWIDKYFSKVGLDLLSDSLNTDKVKNVRILMLSEKIDEKFSSLFEDLKKEFKEKNVKCELRVITNNKLKAVIHDRWIISENLCYNIPSTDTVARGQYSEVKETTNKPPFAEWWEKSKEL